MNHYPHHIGDFNSATRHLTRVERSLYRDLLELYYDTEAALNSNFEKLARRIVCEEQDKAALQDVLDEFFVLQDDGWHNHRCDAELAKYHGQVEQASRAGRASAAKRLNPAQPEQFNANATEKPTTVQRPFNDRSTTVQRPLNGRTTNQNQNQNQNQEEHALPVQTPVEPDGSARATAKGAICIAMKSAGISAVNPSHPELQTLIDAGADIGMFVEAARAAAGKGKGFAYALATVTGQMRDAVALAGVALAVPMGSGAGVGAAGRFGKPDVSRITVAENPDIAATRRRLDEDAAIPRTGPSLAVLEQMARLRQPAAVGVNA